ncbi:unnamed protein product [Heligmosomoides polygyrus]|uniref:Serine-threonine/tyrosine-protein kinase catalytic domain-containing protein n=1 Tax=Heligmosomoides polygyrus TaxID=6339 RepID=A0A3P8BZ06_HELPZ|nr:unnamed protein product [Heligmosomoides polygyrus]
MLWEIMTMGGTPYPTIAMPQLYSVLKGGYRMEAPQKCPAEIYDLMVSCWQVSHAGKIVLLKRTFTSWIGVQHLRFTGVFQPQHTICDDNVDGGGSALVMGDGIEDSAVLQSSDQDHHYCNQPNNCPPNCNRLVRQHTGEQGAVRVESAYMNVAGQRTTPTRFPFPPPVSLSDNHSV